MPTPVLMPQMGESIAEGTVVRWIKKVGDAVDRDEPLFEISTDKVDAEIPAPAAGVLTEIKVKEGETVAVNSVVATIGTSSEVSEQEPEAPPAPPPVAPSRDAVVPAGVVDQPNEKAAAPQRKTNGRSATASKPVEDDSRKQRSSPLVRRIARDNEVDISRIHGSGLGGRVTKNDILEYIEAGTRDSGLGVRDSPGPRSARITDPESRIPVSVSRIPVSMYSRMSFFVTRPPRPEPWIWEMSTSLSRAMRRTSGDDRCLRGSSSTGLLADAERPFGLREAAAGLPCG